MTLRTIAGTIVTALALCIGSAPALAQVQCGDTITERVVMTENLVCDGFDPALTIDGGTLRMNGHTISCSDWAWSPYGWYSTGIRLEGRNSRVLGGTIDHCYLPLFLNGIGEHTVRDVIAVTVDVGVALTVSSNRNNVTGLVQHRGMVSVNLANGFYVYGDHNRIADSSFLTRHASFISGTGNILQRVEIGGLYNGLSVGGTRNKIIDNRQIGAINQGISVGGSGHLVLSNVSNGNLVSGFEISGDRIRFINNEALGNGYHDIWDDNPNCGNNLYRANKFGSANQDCIR
jgi:hypothetical protein